jgi:hypothetical protein
MNDMATKSEPSLAKTASAAGLLEEIKSKAHQSDALYATAYREGLKDAGGFMGLMNAMSDSLPQKKELQDRFARYVHGDFA